MSWRDILGVNTPSIPPSQNTQNSQKAAQPMSFADNADCASGILGSALSNNTTPTIPEALPLVPESQIKPLVSNDLDFANSVQGPEKLISKTSLPDESAFVHQKTHCQTCLHRAPNAACGQPVEAGLAHVFSMLWHPKDGDGCTAWAPKPSPREEGEVIWLDGEAFVAVEV